MQMVIASSTLWSVYSRTMRATDFRCAAEKIVGTWMKPLVGRQLFQVSPCMFTSTPDSIEACEGSVEAVRMVRKSKWLKQKVGVSKDNLYVEQTHGRYVALGGDADSTDGLSPNCCVIDELHAHKSRDLLGRVVNGLFQVGLSLQSAAGLPHDAAISGIDLALRHVDDIIREIRGELFGAPGRPAGGTPPDESPPGPR